MQKKYNLDHTKVHAKNVPEVHANIRFFWATLTTVLSYNLFLI